MTRMDTIQLDIREFHVCPTNVPRIEDAFSKTYCTNGGKEKTCLFENAHEGISRKRCLMEEEHSAAMAEIALYGDMEEEEEEEEEDEYEYEDKELVPVRPFQKREKQREDAVREVMIHGSDADLSRESLVALIRWLQRKRESVDI